MRKLAAADRVLIEDLPDGTSTWYQGADKPIEATAVSRNPHVVEMPVGSCGLGGGISWSYRQQKLPSVLGSILIKYSDVRYNACTTSMNTLN